MKLLYGLIALGVVGCAAEPDTSSTTSDSSVWQWTDDVKLPNQSSSRQVALASFGGRLHMLHTVALSGPLQWSIFNGETWSAGVELPQHADGSPALTVFNNRIAAVYKPRGENRIVMMTSDGHSWTTPVNAGSTLGTAQLISSPAIAVQSGTLYAAYCVRTSDGDKVRVDWLSTDWSMMQEIPTLGVSCRNVTLSTLPDGRLDLLISTEGSSSWYMKEAIHNVGARYWAPPANLTMKSKTPMSIVTCNGLTHLVHGGYSTPSEIWWTLRDDTGWQQDVPVPHQASTGGAALGCFQGTRPIMVHNGGYDELWWSEFMP